jgi:hypothetical protein
LLLLLLLFAVFIVLSAVVVLAQNGAMSDQFVAERVPSVTKAGNIFKDDSHVKTFVTLADSAAQNALFHDSINA